MKILITGHKGFIGSHIYEGLKKDGYTVDGIDLGDSLEDKRYDAIVHMGARGLIRKSVEMPYEYFMDDLSLTMRFLEKARKDGSIFIYPTSGSTAKPTNPYSLAKKQGAEWVSLYRDLYGMDAYILKFFNIYGEGSKKGAVYLFTRAALEGREASVYGDGSHVRDYVNVSDVVKLTKKILQNNIKPGDYEVGSGKGTSVNELIGMIEKFSGKPVPRKHEDYLLEEAESLYARDPILEDPMPLEDGVKEVIGFVRGLIASGQ